jgi:hypothetical protein
MGGRLAGLTVIVALAALGVVPSAQAQEPGGAPQLDPGALNRFYNSARNQHWITPTAVSADYSYELTLGYLLPGGGPGRHAIYGCLAGVEDHFLSLDGNCESQIQLGRYGYAYDSPPELPPTVAVWRCVRPGIGHFASHSAGCEGHTNEGRLGFLPTRGTGLVRTYSPGANVHWVSAAPIPPSWNYETTLGYLLETGGDGRTAIYSCRSGSSDQFLSTDPGCEGREPLGREGWVYATPPAAEETDPLYRCVRPGIGHFASHDPGCEGQKTEALLGHLRRRQSALQQYGSRASGTNWVTTGAPGAGFRYQRTLGFLVASGGSNLHPIYGCRSNSVDHYLSLQADCEGFTSEGREGFAFDEPPGAEETVALYRCIDPGRTHFASLDPNCEGQVSEGRLGYVRTVEQGPPPPPACGTSAGVVEMSLSGKRRRVVRFGRGATMTGRVLRPGGVPAAGADVRILEITDPLVEIGRTTAGPDGSFSFAIPAGSNRALIAGFRADPADPALACSAASRLAVRAKARLRARPHRLRAGRVVHFRGLVRGPRPPRGKLLDLQAFDGGHWRKFATARTRPNGRFRAHYRFSRQARPRTYRFRVRVPREAGFPYIRGYSNKAKVRVRG